MRHVPLTLYRVKVAMITANELQHMAYVCLSIRLLNKIHVHYLSLHRGELVYSEIVSTKKKFIEVTR